MPAGPGTGTISASGTTVTGSGTLFTVEILVGEVVIANGEAKVVTAITDNVTLTINTAFQDSTPSGASFSIALRGVARNGDTAGGAITATAIKTFVNNLAVARVGDSVASHGTGPHASATLVAGSLTVLAEGIAICRLGDPASCGHTISVASTNTFNSN